MIITCGECQTKYRLDVNISGGAIKIQENYMVVDGIQVANDHNVASNPIGIDILYVYNGGIIEISNNIAQYDGSETPGWGDVGILYSMDMLDKLMIYNNIVYDWGYGIFDSYNSDATNVVIYNNTVVNNIVEGFYLRQARRG